MGYWERTVDDLISACFQTAFYQENLPLITVYWNENSSTEKLALPHFTKDSYPVCLPEMPLEPQIYRFIAIVSCIGQ